MFQVQWLSFKCLGQFRIRIKRIVCVDWKTNGTHEVGYIIDRVVFSIYLVYVGSIKLVERVFQQMFVIN